MDLEWYKALPQSQRPIPVDAFLNPGTPPIRDANFRGANHPSFRRMSQNAWDDWQGELRKRHRTRLDQGNGERRFPSEIRSGAPSWDPDWRDPRDAGLLHRMRMRAERLAREDPRGKPFAASLSALADVTGCDAAAGHSADEHARSAEDEGAPVGEAAGSPSAHAV